MYAGSLLFYNDESKGTSTNVVHTGAIILKKQTNKKPQMISFSLKCSSIEDYIIKYLLFFERTK